MERKVFNALLNIHSTLNTAYHLLRSSSWSDLKALFDFDICPSDWAEEANILRKEGIIDDDTYLAWQRLEDEIHEAAERKDREAVYSTLQQARQLWEKTVDSVVE